MDNIELIQHIDGGGDEEHPPSIRIEDRLINGYRYNTSGHEPIHWDFVCARVRSRPLVLKILDISTDRDNL